MTELVFITGLTAAFVIHFMTKSGLREWLMRICEGRRVLEELLECDFCLSWWISLAVAVSEAVLLGEWQIALLAVPSAALARFFL